MAGLRDSYYSPTYAEPTAAPYTADQLGQMGASQAMRGLRSGSLSNTAGGTAYDAIVAAAGGDQGRAAELMGQSRAEAAHSQQWAPDVQSYDQVHDFGTARDYIAQSIGQAFGSSVLPMAGGIAASLLAPRGLKGIAGFAGAAVPSYSMERNEAALQAAQSPTAMANDPQTILNTVRAKGAVNAALEAVVPGTVGTALTGGARQLVKQGIFKTLGKDIAQEAGTEALQQVSGNAFQQHLDPSQQLDEGLVDAALGGAIGGGGMALPHVAAHAALGTGKMAAQALRGEAADGTDLNASAAGGAPDGQPLPGGGGSGILRWAKEQAAMAQNDPELVDAFNKTKAAAKDITDKGIEATVSYFKGAQDEVKGVMQARYQRVLDNPEATPEAKLIAQQKLASANYMADAEAALQQGQDAESQRALDDWLAAGRLDSQRRTSTVKPAKQDNQWKSGDRVQVTLNGSDMFHSGTTVMHLSADKKYAFVDGSQSAVPVESLSRFATRAARSKQNRQATKNAAMGEALRNAGFMPSEEQLDATKSLIRQDLENALPPHMADYSRKDLALDKLSDLFVGDIKKKEMPDAMRALVKLYGSGLDDVALTVFGRIEREFPKYGEQMQKAFRRMLSDQSVVDSTKHKVILDNMSVTHLADMKGQVPRAMLDQLSHLIDRHTAGAFDKSRRTFTAEEAQFNQQAKDADTLRRKKHDRLNESVKLRNRKQQEDFERRGGPEPRPEAQQQFEPTPLKQPSGPTEHDAVESGLKDLFGNKWEETRSLFALLDSMRHRDRQEWAPFAQTDGEMHALDSDEASGAESGNAFEARQFTRQMDKDVVWLGVNRGGDEHQVDNPALDKKAGPITQFFDSKEAAEARHDKIRSVYPFAEVEAVPAFDYLTQTGRDPVEIAAANNFAEIETRVDAARFFEGKYINRLSPPTNSDPLTLDARDLKDVAGDPELSQRINEDTYLAYQNGQLELGPHESVVAVNKEEVDKNGKKTGKKRTFHYLKHARPGSMQGYLYVKIGKVNHPVVAAKLMGLMKKRAHGFDVAGKAGTAKDLDMLYSGIAGLAMLDPKAKVFTYDAEGALVPIMSEFVGPLELAKVEGKSRIAGPSQQDKTRQRADKARREQQFALPDDMRLSPQATKPLAEMVSNVKAHVQEQAQEEVARMIRIGRAHAIRETTVRLNKLSQKITLDKSRARSEHASDEDRETARIRVDQHFRALKDDLDYLKQLRSKFDVSPAHLFSYAKALDQLRESAMQPEMDVGGDDAEVRLLRERIEEEAREVRLESARLKGMKGSKTVSTPPVVEGRREPAMRDQKNELDHLGRSGNWMVSFESGVATWFDDGDSYMTAKRALARIGRERYDRIVERAKADMLAKARHTYRPDTAAPAAVRAPSVDSGATSPLTLPSQKLAERRGLVQRAEANRKDAARIRGYEARSRAAGFAEQADKHAARAAELEAVATPDQIRALDAQTATPIGTGPNMGEWQGAPKPTRKLQQASGRVLLPKTGRYTEKDQAKSDRANKFIGRGSGDSSTAAYAKAWGKRANTGSYTANDVVFVSAEGNRAGRLEPDFAEIKKALDAGATLILDQPKDRQRDYNVGERQVEEFLLANGYAEPELGLFTPDVLRQQELDQQQEAKVVKPAERARELGLVDDAAAPKAESSKRDQAMDDYILGEKYGKINDIETMKRFLTAAKARVAAIKAIPEEQRTETQEEVESWGYSTFVVQKGAESDITSFFTEIDAFHDLSAPLQAELEAWAKALKVSNKDWYTLGRDLQSKKNAQSAEATVAGVASAADIAAVRTELKKMLGNQIKTDFRSDLNYSGEWTEDDTGNLITVATNAGPGMMSVAYHEAMHEIFNRLVTGGHRNDRATLLRVASSPLVLAKLQKLLAGEPAALKQIASDPEERLAYMFQFWATKDKDGNRLLEVGPQATTLFAKLAAYIRKITGKLRDHEKAEAILQAVYDGKLAEPSAIASVLQDINQGEATYRDALRNLQPLVRAVQNLVQPAYDTLAHADNEHLKAIADLFYNDAGDTVRNQGYLNAKAQVSAQWINRFAEIVRDADQSLLREVHDAMNLNQLPASAAGRALQKQLDAMLRDFHRYLTKEKGLKVGKLEHYYPRVWDLAKIADEREAFHALLLQHHKDVLDDVAKSAYKRAMAQHKAEQGSAESAPNPADFTAKTVADQIVSKLSMERGVPTIGENESQTGFTPFMQAINERKLTFLDMEVFAPYLKTDMVQTLSAYLTQGVKRAEYVSRFGGDGAKLNHMLKKAMELEGEKLDAQGYSKEQATAEIAARTRLYGRAIMAMEGTLGHDIAPEMLRFNGAMMVYQNIRLLPLSLFSSLIDPMGLLVRGGTLKQAFEAYQRGVKEVIRDVKAGFMGETPGRDHDPLVKLAERLGTMENAALLDVLGETYSSMYINGKAKRWNDALFRLNGMEGWNRAMRATATQAAIEFIREHASNPTAHSQRWLEELGLTDADVQFNQDGSIKLFAEDGLSVAQAGRMQAAVQRWVDSAVLRPNAAQRPAWGSDPHFALLFHLKQFTYSFHTTILRRVYREAKAGNFAPLVTLPIAYIPIMIAADVTKGLLTNGGEPPEWQKGWALGDYMASGFQRSGLFGIGQFAIDAKNQGLSSLAGPSVQQAVDLVFEPASVQAIKALPMSPLYRDLVFGETLKTARAEQRAEEKQTKEE